MFCTYCGNQVSDGAKFCSKCGKKLGAGNAAQEAEEKAKKSYGIIQSRPGYYCYECGNYVSYEGGSQRCRYCGADKINGNIILGGLSDVINYGIIGTTILNVQSSLQKTDVRSAYSHIVDYYKSEYYRKNQYEFEKVADDKGLMGEYLVDKQYQVLKKSYPGRKFHVLYNLFIPEPNGSFAEIDAAIIYGSLIFVIEAKNRSGSFEINHISDVKWIQQLGNKREEITSPIIQNEWHIDALENFLSSKGIASPSIYNYVSLAGGASFNIHANVDDYDNALLRPWYICNTSKLCECIVEAVQKYDRIYDLQAKADNNTLADQLRKAEQEAQKIIGALRSQIRMDNLEKDLYMHDREETSQNRRRFPYRYYYVEHQSGLGSVVRWNREYIQVIDSTHFEWETDNRWHITDQELPKFAEENAVIYVLDSPIKIARGVDCARYCRLYEDPQGKRCYNYAHYEKTDKKTNSDRNNQEEFHHEESHYEEAHRSDSNEHERRSAYFAGCDTLEILEKRYKSLAKTFHPDGGFGNEELFKAMDAEYRTLKKKFI